MSVFVGVEGPDGETKVLPKRPYQQSAFDTFMSNQVLPSLIYLEYVAILLNHYLGVLS